MVNCEGLKYFYEWNMAMKANLNLISFDARSVTRAQDDFRDRLPGGENQASAVVMENEKPTFKQQVWGLTKDLGIGASAVFAYHHLRLAAHRDLPLPPKAYFNYLTNQSMKKAGAHRFDAEWRPQFRNYVVETLRKSI